MACSGKILKLSPADKYDREPIEDKALGNPAVAAIEHFCKNELYNKFIASKYTGELGKENDELRVLVTAQGLGK